MSFSFGSATTTTGSTFGTTNPSTAFSFAGGDAAKSIFGSSNTENKPSAFSLTGAITSTPSFGGGGFTFGAKTTAAPSSLFNSPPSTQAASAFGTSKPLSFASFGAPPNQTVGSPTFGQAVANAQPAPQNLSFGATTTTQSVLSFGSPTTQATTAQSVASPAFSGISFGGSGSTFKTPTPIFSTPQQAATATTPTAPQTSTSGFSFGSNPTSVNFGSTPSFNVGLTAPTTTNVQKPGLSFGQPGQTGFAALSTTSGGNLGQTTGLSFGGVSSSTPAFGLASPPYSFPQPSQPSVTTSLNTFAPAATANPPVAPTSSFKFGPNTTTASLSFSLPATTSTAAPSFAPIFTGLSFSTTTSSTAQSVLAPKPTTAGDPPSFPTASTAATTSATEYQLSGVKPGPLPSFNPPTSTATTQPTTTGYPQLGGQKTASLSFSLPTSTAATQPSSTAPGVSGSGISTVGPTTTAVASMPSLVTATTTTPAVPPQPISTITFAQLEENINKWTLDLEEHEKTFINQATQINAWDRLLIANGEKIVELNEAVQTVKNEQQSLEHELDFVLAQQKELEELLSPLEKILAEQTGDRLRDPEREHMYQLAENLDSQLRQMSEDLKEVIEHLNETNRSQDSSDPIVQIGRILNAHMSSMQWVDNSIAQISTKLDQLKATHDTLRRDNERSFQLAYN